MNPGGCVPFQAVGRLSPVTRLLWLFLWAWPWSCVGGVLQFVVQPVSGVAVQGRPYWLHCRADGGSALVTYLWRFNERDIIATGIVIVSSRIVYPNGTLLIGDVEKENVGQYTCVATSGGSSIYSRPASLQLAYIAQTFSFQPQNTTVALGQGATLTCGIESFPSAFFLWRRNGLGLPVMTVNSGQGLYVNSLVLPSVAYRDAGQYACAATNSIMSVTRYSNSATLTVVGKPEMTSLPQSRLVPVSYSVSFDCVAVGVPLPRVTWFKSTVNNAQSPVQPSDRLTIFFNGTLQIERLTTADSGNYICVATNDRGQDSVVAVLTVTGLANAPTITVKPQEQSLLQGSSLMLNCVATGNPPPSITWWKDGVHLETDNDTALLLPEVTPQDAGNYVCLASNQEGNVTASAYVNVLYAPVFQQKPGNVTATEGADVTLPCWVLGSPPPVLQWITPSSVILPLSSESDRLSVDWQGTLTIRAVRLEDDGRYTCYASNQLDSLTAVVLVTVEGPPHFIAQPRSQVALAGDITTFTCHAAGYPPPMVTWYRQTEANEELIQQSSRRLLSPYGDLTVVGVALPDDGTYRCVAHNAKGSIQAFAVLTVHVPPECVVTPESRAVALGDNVSWTCRVSGVPVPSQRWVRAGETLASAGNVVVSPDFTRLNITSVRSDQLGPYNCVARNQAGQRSVTSSIYLSGQPYFTLLPLNTTANVSEPTTLSCRAETPHPDLALAPTVRWFKGLRQTTADVLMGSAGTRFFATSDGDLIFTEVWVDDEGWYYCTAQNSDAAIYSDPVYLNVQVPPSIESVSKPPTTADRGQATLSCHALGDPDPKVTWRSPAGREVKETSADYVVDAAGGVLTIRAALTARDSGAWTCVACNDLGCDTAATHLGVQGVPVIRSVQASRNATTLRISCRSEGLPAPAVNFWAEGGEVSGSPGHVTVNSEEGSALLYVALTAKKATYTCIAQNSFGTDSVDLSAPLSPDLRSALPKPSPGGVTLAMTVTGKLSGLPLEGVVVEYRLANGNDNWTSAYIQVEGINPATDGENLTVSVPDLVPYSVYLTRVRLVNVLGEGPVSAGSVRVFTLPAAPPPPVNITARSDNRTVVITWSLPAHLNGEKGDVSSHVVVVDPSGHPVFQTLLKADQPAKVTLHDRDIGNHSVTLSTVNSALQLWSTNVTVFVTVTQAVPTFVPSILSVVGISDSVMQVSWSVPADSSALDPPVTGYVLRLARPSSPGSSPLEFLVNGPHVGAFNVSGLAERQECTVSVAAFNAGGLGFFSQAVVGVTRYALFSSKAYSPTIELSWRGQWVAVLGGCLGAAVLLLVLACGIWKWRQRYYGSSLDLMQPSHGLDPLYLENPDSVVNCAMGTYKKKPDDLSTGIHLRHQPVLPTVEINSCSGDSLNVEVFSQSGDSLNVEVFSQSGDSLNMEVVSQRGDSLNMEVFSQSDQALYY